MKKAEHTDTRSEGEKIIAGIEHDNEWRCVWQLKTFGNRKLVELFIWPATQSTVVVVKDFDEPIKTGNPWPKMIGCEVYVPISNKDKTWRSLEAALEQFKQEHMK